MGTQLRQHQSHIVLDAIRRRLPLILLITLLVTSVAGAFAMTRTAAYTSTAKVFVRPILGNALSPASTNNGPQITVAMVTEANLVGSPEVAALASKKLGTPLPSGDTPVTATVPPNSEVVQIQFRASSPSSARDGAQAFADAYLEYRSQQATTVQMYQLGSLDQQATDAKARLKEATTAAGTKSPPPDALAQVDVYASRLATLQASIGEMKALDRDPGSVITPAETPTAPVGVNIYLFLLGAAIVGLGVGLGLAVWRQQGDGRVHAKRQPHVGGLPVLACLASAADRRTLITGVGADDPLRDEYRRARAAIVAASATPSILVVSGVSDTEPVDALVANLGLSLAEAGYRVTVVDAAAHRGRVADLLGVQSEPGLSDLLRHGSPEAPNLVESSGVSVLPPGRDPATFRDALSGPRMRSVLATLLRSTDYVIVAAPPVSTPDGLAIAAAGDGLALAVSEGQTRRRQVTRVLAQVEQAGVPTLGVISVPAERGRRHAGSPDLPASRSGDKSSESRPAHGPLLDERPPAHAVAVSTGPKVTSE